DETPQQLESRSRYHQAVTLHCNDLESVANKIQNLAKVSSIEYQEDQRSITAFPEKGQSIFKEINALVDENEWQVSAIQMESGRLDEVFRTITTGVTGQ
ncbi:MAG: ABC transporter ATP-binding protein, partial [bacterium]